MDSLVSRQKRNPDWSRDELILAFDLYMRFRQSIPGHDTPAVQELSNHLNKLGRALGQGNTDTYRNTNGVYMKLMNFRRFDPLFTAEGGEPRGLKRGNKEEGVVWNEFIGNPERLRAVATAIRETVEVTDAGNGFQRSDEDPLEAEAEEGRLLTRLHMSRERSRLIVRLKKEEVLERLGYLMCEVCEFNFEKEYGSRIAAHARRG